MKKNKLFQSALSLMLVGGMLTACGSSASSTAASTAASTGSDSTAASTASDSAAPAATKQYVIGIAEPNISGAGQKRPAPHFLVRKEEVGVRS